jgi:hypothetical protein
MPEVENVPGITLPNGRFLRTHSPDACRIPERCVIHNPSDHHMREWPLNWRGDRGLMERICKHGTGHPDPDDIAYKTATAGEQYADVEAVHGCDECCVPPYEGRHRQE